MDLGLKGKCAIVCAASKGLGRACADSLAAEGVDLVINARTEATLRETAEWIAGRHGVSVTPVAGDVTAPDIQAAMLAATPAPDILINNAGGPPPGDFRDWRREDWVKAVTANMITPIELIKATIDGMIKRKFGRIVNITSGAVKAPIPILGLSNGARAGLTGFVAGLSRQVAKHNVVINNLLPGAHDTDRWRGNIANLAAREGKSADEMAAQAMEANPTGRVGAAEEFGQVCAFLCSTHVSYMVGQNVMLDGGAFNSTF